MTVRTILTCILTEASAPHLAEEGAKLAERFDALLIGHHTIGAVIVHPGVAAHIPPETLASLRDAHRAEAAAIGAAFQEVTDRVGVRSEWRSVEAGTVPAADRMMESARSVDLVMMARPAADDGGSEPQQAVDRLIRDSGRPVLLVPESGLGEGIGKTVVIAHAGTRESARAAFDLLPLLENEADLHLVHVGDEMDELRDGVMTALSAALARHGHRVTMVHRAPHGASVAKTLQTVAAEVGADLIAAGAYGHSRAYAFFLGATTGELILNSAVPVLFSA